MPTRVSLTFPKGEKLFNKECSLRNANLGIQRGKTSSSHYGHNQYAIFLLEGLKRGWDHFLKAYTKTYQKAFHSPMGEQHEFIKHHNARGPHDH